MAMRSLCYLCCRVGVHNQVSEFVVGHLYLGRSCSMLSLVVYARNEHGDRVEESKIGRAKGKLKNGQVLIHRAKMIVGVMC